MIPTPAPADGSVVGAGAPSPGTCAYVARTSVLEDLREYRLGADMLYVVRNLPTDPTPANTSLPPLPQMIPLTEITQVRLRYFPTRVQTNRYECIVTTRQHGQFKITNERYLGVMQFRNQSAAFRTFVLELCRRVAEANPQTIFVRGRPRIAYLLEHGFLIAMLLLLAAVLWMVGGAMRGIAVVKLALLVLYLPFAFKYAVTNRPASFDPRQVPHDILPRPSVEPAQAT